MFKALVSSRYRHRFESDQVYESGYNDMYYRMPFYNMHTCTVDCEILAFNMF